MTEKKWRLSKEESAAHMKKITKWFVVSKELSNVPMPISFPAMAHIHPVGFVQFPYNHTGEDGKVETYTARYQMDDEDRTIVYCRIGDARTTYGLEQFDFGAKRMLLWADKKRREFDAPL